MFDRLNVKTGNIKLNDCCFDVDDDLCDILDNLKEDLLQIEFSDGCFIDVGWYPEFNIEGSFQVLLIEKCHWDNPKEQYQTRDLKELEKIVNLLIEKI